MTPVQFKAALKRLKISQRTFAKLVHLDRRTVTRYATGRSRIPTWCGLLLEAWTREGRVPEGYRPKRHGRPTKE